MEIKISHKPVAYKNAMDFLEQRVEKVHANLEEELIWILEHDSVYTKGISASNKDLLEPNLFPVVETNRGGKFTYHGPGQKIVYFVINLNKRDKEIKKFVRNIEKWIISILKDFDITSFAEVVPIVKGKLSPILINAELTLEPSALYPITNGPVPLLLKEASTLCSPLDTPSSYLTSNLVDGLAVPIPTLPALVMRTCSV